VNETLEVSSCLLSHEGGGTIVRVEERGVSENLQSTSTACLHAIVYIVK
jgi:hypothetical protein